MMTLPKLEVGSQSVASEGRLRDAGAQQAERTRQYVSIASTAGARAAERSSFASRPIHTAELLPAASARPARRDRSSPAARTGRPCR
ncbi:MAG: hypothetical protein EPN40_13730 [Rhodanobacteraceae bacterium]|nr:MAG: hypothetical protein EPN40_13730 [Rhodanobacteraceae bacterium]